MSKHGGMATLSEPIATGDYAEQLKGKTIAEIARDVRRYWLNVNFAAKPYLDAMLELNTLDDNYGADGGVSVVLYFLSNATSFRGPFARAIKHELNHRLNEQKGYTAR